MTSNYLIYLQPIYVEIQEITFPPENNIKDIPSALDTLERQQKARVIRAAAYVFATIATAATIVLTEGRLITWSIAVPTITIALVSWAIFWWINRLDERYVKGLDNNQRKELANNELRRLLFEEKLEAFADDRAFIRSFENINKLFGCQVISFDFIQKVLTIKKGGEGSKTLFELALEQGIPLLISFKEEFIEPGWFGRKPMKKKIDIQWTGKRDDLIQVSFNVE